MDAAERPLYAVRLSPHRSLTRGQGRVLVAIFALASAAVSAPFFAMGAWPVVGFLGLDALAMWVALTLSFRAARAYEDVTVTPLELALAKVSAEGRRREWRFNPLWVRLEREAHEEFGVQRLALVSHGQAVEFARFLGPDEKAAVAADMSTALSRARRGPDFSECGH